MLEVHAILQRQRCNENITKKTGTLSDAYNLLAKYFNKFKDVFNAQTNYNEKIIGKKYNTEFYTSDMVEDNRFAKHMVAF